MNRTEFTLYQSRYQNAIERVLVEAEKGRLDEAAFPAYSHNNPLINWLFWERIRKAMAYIEAQESRAQILDFGCGSGVMLPFLSRIGEKVTAMDIDLHPLELIGKHIPLADNIVVNDGLKFPIETLPAESFDMITALDVLEHVPDLIKTLRDLLRLLKPGGQLIVSGPTENILYRLGRKFAGPEYSGAYHERGIAEIKEELAKMAEIKPIATLYQPFPLFELFAGEKKTGNAQP